MFLAARLCCSFSMKGDIHTVLDFLSLVSTLWVVYRIRFKSKSTYIAKLDTVRLYYVVMMLALSLSLLQASVVAMLVNMQFFVDDLSNENLDNLEFDLLMIMIFHFRLLMCCLHAC